MTLWRKKNMKGEYKRNVVDGLMTVNRFVKLSILLLQYFFVER